MYRVGLLILFTLWMTTGPVVADERANIRGSVQNSDGEPVRVEFLVLRYDRDRATTPRLQGEFSRTAADGSFSITDIEPGWYMIVMMPDETRYKQSSIFFRLPPGRTATLWVPLELGDKPLVLYESPTPDDLASFDNWLTAMHEPSFCSPSVASDSVESYRALLVTFAKRPLLVSLSFLKGDVIFAKVKQTDGVAGYEAGNLIRSEELDVRVRLQEEVKGKALAIQLLDTVRDEAIAGFWTIAFDYDDGSLPSTTDGGWVAVEGVRDGRCHVAVADSFFVDDRIPPPEGTPTPFFEPFSRLPR